MANVLLHACSFRRCYKEINETVLVQKNVKLTTSMCLWQFGCSTSTHITTNVHLKAALSKSKNVKERGERF